MHDGADTKTNLKHQLLRLFVSSTRRRIGEIEAALGRASGDGADAEVMRQIAIHLHTLKGDASLLGLDAIEVLAAALENTLSREQASGVFGGELQDTFRRALPVFTALLPEEGAAVTRLESYRELLGRLEAFGAR